MMTGGKVGIQNYDINNKGSSIQKRSLKVNCSMPRRLSISDSNCAPLPIHQFFYIFDSISTDNPRNQQILGNNAAVQVIFFLLKSNYTYFNNFKWLLVPIYIRRTFWSKGFNKNYWLKFASAHKQRSTSPTWNKIF